MMLKLWVDLSFLPFEKVKCEFIELIKQHDLNDPKGRLFIG